VLKLRVGGVDPRQGGGDLSGQDRQGRLEHELRRAGDHHTRCTRQEKQAHAACHPWRAAGAVGGARRRTGCRRRRYKRRARMVPPRPSARDGNLSASEGRQTMLTRARRGRGTLYKLLVAYGNQHGSVSAAGGASARPLRRRCHERRGRLTSPRRATANGQPERVLRPIEDGAPRSERQRHAIQAAARAWRPASALERPGACGASGRMTGGPDPPGGVAACLGRIDRRRPERELRRPDEHSARYASCMDQAHAACRSW
jgi:hypothetical protein